MEMTLGFARAVARTNGRTPKKAMGTIIDALCDKVEADATVLQALREDRDKLRATLRDVLARFSEPGHPGRDCLRTGWTPVEQVATWRALVAVEAPDAG